MKQFVPDQELLREVFGAYMVRGLRFEVMTELFEGTCLLQVQLSAGSTVAPLLPLPATQMQTPEAARQWLEYLRDVELVKFTRKKVG
ncbi:hypothetical protein [Hymenobacter sp. UYP22]|uniref:hypothetical protein n=1 Tax=Hymenobacter sp. UYP22 TaxID=3156348 RepID=UPI0033966519